MFFFLINLNWKDCGINRKIAVYVKKYITTEIGCHFIIVYTIYPKSRLN